MARTRSASTATKVFTSWSLVDVVRGRGQAGDDDDLVVTLQAFGEGGELSRGHDVGEIGMIGDRHVRFEGNVVLEGGSVRLQLGPSGRSAHTSSLAAAMWT